jgi:RNA polymerase sigma-70 factor (ECF subfamily)
VPDIVADVFVVAWRRFDDVPSPPLPWLLGVARKTVSNHLRSARRRSALTERLEGAERTAAGEAADNGAVALALPSLGERDRKAVMLVAWDGLSGREAAKVLGCSSRGLPRPTSRRLGYSDVEALQLVLEEADPDDVAAKLTELVA